MPALRRRALLTAASAALALGVTVAVPAPASAASAAATPIKPVASLDLQRYLGTWKQLADIPQPYEAFCVRDTTAQYSLNADGTVKVRNTCTGPLGVPIAITGAARVLDPVRRSSLQVTFLKLAGKPIFVGDSPNYVVIGIATDYSWAVVGSPDRSSAYLLSRTVTLPAGKLAAAKTALSRSGYDPCSLTVTRQTGGASTKGPLC